jgi:hypothetical protein
MDKIILVGLATAVVAAAIYLLARRRPSLARSGGLHSSSAAVRRRGVRVNWLVGQQPSEIAGKAWHIGQRIVTVGRGVGNYIQVLDESVSRIQCQLVPDERGLVLTDKANQRTLVNGDAVRQHRLLDGDVIRVGGTALIYRSYGDFGVDQGMLRKEVGARVVKPTHHSEVQTVGEMLQEALRASGGDTQEAARAIGMQHHFFLRMMHKQRLNPDDFRARVG